MRPNDKIRKREAKTLNYPQNINWLNTEGSILHVKLIIVYQVSWKSCKLCTYACMNTCHKPSVLLHSARKRCMCYHKQWVADCITFILHADKILRCCYAWQYFALEQGTYEWRKNPKTSHWYNLSGQKSKNTILKIEECTKTTYPGLFAIQHAGQLWY